MNKFFFTNLDQFEAYWILRKDGQAVREGMLGRTDVAPQASQVVTIDAMQSADAAGEYLLTVGFRLAEAISWADRGHVVAWDQLE